MTDLKQLHEAECPKCHAVVEAEETTCYACGQQAMTVVGHKCLGGFTSPNWFVPGTAPPRPSPEDVEGDLAWLLALAEHADSTFVGHEAVPRVEHLAATLSAQQAEIERYRAAVLADRATIQEHQRAEKRMSAEIERLRNVQNVLARMVTSTLPSDEYARFLEEYPSRLDRRPPDVIAFAQGVVERATQEGDA